MSMPPVRPSVRPVPPAPVQPAEPKPSTMSLSQLKAEKAQIEQRMMVSRFTEEGLRQITARLGAVVKEIAKREKKPTDTSTLKPSQMTVAQLRTEKARIEQVMMVSRFTEEGLRQITARLDAVTAELDKRLSRRENAPVAMNPAAFAARIAKLSTSEVRAELSQARGLLMVAMFTPAGAREHGLKISLLEKELAKRSTGAAA